MAPESFHIDVERYLARIGLSRAPSIDVDGLEVLQRAHMTAVPFENLDVFAERGVGTSLDWSIPKVVDRRRGGWCFEINGAFSALLIELGFSVRRLAATVLLEPVSSHPTHLTLEVSLEKTYLVDVGFGDSFIRPLLFGIEEPQDDGSGLYVLASSGEAGDQQWLLSRMEDGEASPKYRFGMSEWTLVECEPASRQLQADASLHWRKSPFATRLLDQGPDRVTLLKDRIKFLRSGEWSERAVPDSEWENELRTWFSLTP